MQRYDAGPVIKGVTLRLSAVANDALAYVDTLHNLARHLPGTRQMLKTSCRRRMVPAFAFVALVLVGVPIVYYERAAFRDANATSAMVGETVNDHLRVLSGQRPLEIESGGFTR